MKQLFIGLIAVVAVGCGSSAGSETQTSASEAGSSASAPGRNKDWVDQATLDALPAADKTAILQGDDTPVGGSEYVLLAEKLKSQGANERTGAVRAITLTMANAKGDYLEALNRNVGPYLIQHTKEFLGLFGGDGMMSKPEMERWAVFLRGSDRDLVQYERAMRLIGRMQERRAELSPKESKVLDHIASRVADKSGQNPGLK